jgi:hypothetical protein
MARERAHDGSDPQVCEECRDETNSRMPAHLRQGPGIPLAKVRAALTEPLDVEVTALLNEECAETGQRISKIQRWGWDADFAGTTQKHKLHLELGDIIAAMVVADHNGRIDLYEVIAAANAKLEALREDAAGPRQRLMVATVPQGALAYDALTPLV